MVHFSWVFCLSQIEEIVTYFSPKTCEGPYNVKLKRPLRCSECRGWFEGSNCCPGCNGLARFVTASWSYWLWAIMAQIHNQLQARYRERRGVVTLLGVPPAVGFALLAHFARPRPAKNKAPVYTSTHPSYKQGTSAGKKYHFIKFAYNNFDDVEWAFPLHDYYPKTSMGPVRLASSKRWQDGRVWGSPVQFKYKWAVQHALGVPTPGVHTFTICCNITHVGRAAGAARYNVEYNRWVAELQMQHLQAMQRAVAAFPARPLRATHHLSGVVHPLQEWQPVMPVVYNSVISVSDDEDDDPDDDDVDEGSDESDDCTIVGSGPQCS